jgi:nitroimidazol reductase NimA-like FMN-containing flavoprotein (pyridoxamine 5'-phosphate oxidase superfamily)
LYLINVGHARIEYDDDAANTLAMKFTKSETDFIKSQNVGHVATISSEGMPHNVPVCPVFDSGRVYFGSETNAKKVKNIKFNPRVAIVFDVYSDSWKELQGVMLQCKARIVDSTEFKKVRRKLYAKYPQYETEAALEPKDSVIIELEPSKKFSWGFE